MPKGIRRRLSDLNCELKTCFESPRKYQVMDLKVVWLKKGIPKTSTRNTSRDLTITLGIFVPIAFVLINTEPVSMPEVNEAIRAVRGVEQSEMVYGVYDIVAKVKAETMEELKQIIAYKIRKIKNVLTTQTILVVDKKRPISGVYSSLVAVRKIDRGFLSEP